MTAARMVSGFGQYHTNEADPKKPGKKLTPYVTIDLAGVRALVDNPRRVPKADGQWLIPSTLLSRNFAKQEAEGEFVMLWADLDTAPPPQQQVVETLTVDILGGANYEVYSSRSATADKPKKRVLIPLGQPLTGADWMLVQEVLNDELEAVGILPDRAAERPGQLAYLPNRGEHYESASERSGQFFDPLSAWADKIESKRQALADAAAALEAAKQAAKARREARAAQAGGTEGRKLMDAFNDAYDVADILIQAGYDQRGDTFRHPASESGSYSAGIRDDGTRRRVHSLSSSDPLYTGGRGGGAHDAFSAFTVLMHDGDQAAALRAAGDQWLTIGGEPWNTVERREWAQRQQMGEGLPFQPLPSVGATPPTPLFTVVPLADLAHATPPAPSYWWQDYMPAGVVTMLSAHGGAGKSTMALMLAVCISQGLPLFSIPTRRGRVAFFSGEDGAELVRHRLHRICQRLGVDPAALDGWLHVLDATEGDPVLYREESVRGARHGASTPSYAALREYIAENEIDVLIVDNASDAFDASEIDRARVRGFARELANIARERGGAVLLLAHVDKGTSRGERTGTESYSGSTAWHNSARSRMFLGTDNEGVLVLAHQKANLGKLRQPLRLLWPQDDVLQVEARAQAGRSEADAPDDADTRALLRLIAEFTGRGEFVPTSRNGRPHAAKMLRDEPSYPKRLHDNIVFGLLRDAERRGWLARDSVRSSGRSHQKEVWRVTPQGAEAAKVFEFISDAPSAPSARRVELGALGAPGAEAAPSAPSAAQGVRGCVGRTPMAGELGADDAEVVGAAPSAPINGAAARLN